MNARLARWSVSSSFCASARMLLATVMIGTSSSELFEPQFGDLGLLARGNGELEGGLVVHACAQQLEHLARALAGCADDEDEPEAREVGLVLVTQCKQSPLVCSTDAGLLLVGPA